MPNETKVPHLRRWLIGLAVTAAVVLIGAGGFAGLMVWKVVASNLGDFTELRSIVEADYPDFHIVDTTRLGYILQHNEVEDLRIDIRFFRTGKYGDFPGQPLEPVNAKWLSNETFFRHAEGMEPDPRTGENYNVDVFTRAYVSLRPGPRAAITGVWRAQTDPDFELFDVWMAHRNRGETASPDHVSVFARLQMDYSWTGEPFLFTPVDPTPER